MIFGNIGQPCWLIIFYLILSFMILMIHDIHHIDQIHHIHDINDIHGMYTIFPPIPLYVHVSD